MCCLSLTLSRPTCQPFLLTKQPIPLSGLSLSFPHTPEYRKEKEERRKEKERRRRRREEEPP
jgi:hypothetical protein